MEAAPQASGLAAEAITEIREGLEGRSFESLEEANAFAREITAHRNSAPLEEFSGLSPDMMFRFLHFPFESPGLVSFAEDFAAPLGVLRPLPRVQHRPTGLSLFPPHAESAR